jgi:(p)ppGpp synthase/HD superfamily hydrolase
MIAAILHDVVEDTDVSHADLRKEGFSPVVLEAIKLLTHEDEVPYMDYVARVAAHPVARSVKLADLEDNMNLREIPEMTERDCARSRKYHTAWKRLKEFEQSHAEATSNTARSAVSEASDA